jgi:tol-pal system protein YbgF
MPRVLSLLPLIVFLVAASLTGTAYGNTLDLPSDGRKSQIDGIRLPIKPMWQADSETKDLGSHAIILAQNQQTNPSMARFDVRLTELERDLRSTTGQIEELHHQLQLLNERLDKLTADVDYRLTQQGSAAQETAKSPAGRAENVPQSSQISRTETQAVPGEGPTVLGSLPASDVAKGKTGPESSTESEPAQASASTDGGVAAETPREQYAYGYGLLRKGEHDQAEAAFKKFLSEYPSDPLADNARYWLGETYYVRGKYALAAETFLDGYQHSKNGPKAPDTLLKLGMSLANLEKVREACATYDELEKSIPDAPLSIKDRAEQERQRLGCK